MESDKWRTGLPYAQAFIGCLGASDNRVQVPALSIPSNHVGPGTDQGATARGWRVKFPPRLQIVTKPLSLAPVSPGSEAKGDENGIGYQQVLRRVQPLKESHRPARGIKRKEGLFLQW